jgi:hypothetical protein
METLVATIFTILLAAGTGVEIADAGECRFVKAENSNFLYAENPGCYGADPIGARDEADL